MPKVLLGDVARERKETCKGSKVGYPIVGLEHLVPEEITLTAWSEDSENTFSKMFHKGDVLFGRRRAYLKKAAVAPFDGICSGDITVIEANAERIVPELLPFIIQNDALFDFAVGKSAGSLSPRVKWEHLKNYEFELPDIGKQRELSEVLWSIDATKKAYQGLLSATDDLIKSLFLNMFGDPVKNPKGWKVCALKDVMSDNASNGFFAKPKEYCEDGNAGIICVGDVVNRKFSNIENLRRANASDKDFEKFKVRYGDMLFCRSSLVKAGIGKASIIPQEVGDDILFECHVIRVPLDIDKVLPEYMQAFSVTDYFRGQMIEKSKTATMTTIGQKDIITTDIFVPPMEQQLEFVVMAERSDKSKSELEHAFSELTATSKAIIAKNLG